MTSPDAEEWVETYLHLKKMCSSLKFFHLKTQSFRKNAIFGINRKNSPLKSCRKLLIFGENTQKNEIFKISPNFEFNVVFYILLPGDVQVIVLKRNSCSLRQNNF